MMRLNALEENGGFDVDLRNSMDLGAFLKLREFGKFAFTKQGVSALRWYLDF
jgi:hypothetical protein